MLYNNLEPSSIDIALKGTSNSLPSPNPSPTILNLHPLASPTSHVSNLSPLAPPPVKHTLPPLNTSSNSQDIAELGVINKG